MMTIGDNIRRYRENIGITQTELAKRIGKTRSVVSQYESGKIRPRMGTVEDLASALGVRKSDLVDDTTTYSVVSIEERFAEIPLLGSIAAGTPIEMLPVDETFPCPVRYVSKYGDNLYYLRVVGNSVNRIIPNGYLALIAASVRTGSERDLFAVCVNGYDATIKHVRKLDNGVELVPDSYDPTIKSMVYDYADETCEEVTIMGKVVWATMPFDREI